MPNYVYPAIALIGGGTGALDAIDGTALADKDMAMVSVQGDKTYFYVLNATSGAAEASPGIIAPDANGGAKRWLLVGFTPVPAATGFTIAGGTTSKTLTVTADTSLDEAVAMSSKAPKANPIFTGNVSGASGDQIFAGVNATNLGIFSVGGGKTGGSAVILADNQSITITFSPMALLLSIGNNNTGHAALFFISNASGTITALADVGTEWDLTDVDNAKLAIWKGATNAVVWIKNYTNATKNLTINVLGVVTSSTAPA